MNANERGFKYFELTQKIIGVYYDVYNELGVGFQESVYQKSLALALESAGLKVCSRIDIPVWFRGHQVGQFEGDLLVEQCVLLELKAARALGSAHQTRLMNYLRATEIEVGLLLNFGPKPEFKRVAYDNSRKRLR
jgi:GxxExxY protein